MFVLSFDKKVYVNGRNYKSYKSMVSKLEYYLI